VTGRTRVVLADDHPVVLAGLRGLVEADARLELIGQAGNGLAALTLIREKEPDVAVIDVSMPGLNGIALAKRLAAEVPSVGVLVLTLHEDRAYVNQALQAGVRGYALKRSATENLVHAIRAVSLGGLYIDPAIADQMFDPDRRLNRKSGRSGGVAELTSREAEVLKRTAQGQTNKEIARDLDVSVKSVETYKARGAEKLGLGTRADIVRYASTQGWLDAI
jgi:DNA-binding NarL/FixJ family response regulator